MSDKKNQNPEIFDDRDLTPFQGGFSSIEDRKFYSLLEEAKLETYEDQGERIGSEVESFQKALREWVLEKAMGSSLKLDRGEK